MAASRVLNRNAPFGRNFFAVVQDVIDRGLLDANDSCNGGFRSQDGFGQLQCFDAYVLHTRHLIGISIMLSIETTIRRGYREFYSLRPMRSLGERIAARLDELKKSQHWLAQQSGIKQPSINAIINPKDGKQEAGTAYLVPIARALGVLPDWLWDETGPKFAPAVREAVLVGNVGAGNMVVRFDEGVVLQGGIEPPAGYERANVARIEGSSMYPLEPGWLIFYGDEHRGVLESDLNKLCVLGLDDGTTLIKKLRRQGKRFRLESWNAEPIEDAKVVWASRVIDIRPT